MRHHGLGRRLLLALCAICYCLNTDVRPARKLGFIPRGIMSDFMIAYCGPAALPDDLWTRWDVDPLLIAMLIAIAIAVGSGRSSDARAGWGAIVLMFIIFVSPLCAMASALFSVRVLHHVLLISAVAPLLALAFARRPGSIPIAVLVAVHAVILWLWHTPGLYTWGLASVPAYWLMQTSLLGSAWLLWRAILGPSAIWSCSDCAGRDYWADGPSRRVDRLRAQARLPPASGERSKLGHRAAHGPATCRFAYVGSGDAALPGCGNSDRVVRLEI